MDKRPLVSIITVVYNGEKYLEETVQSVLNQTYDNVEYIIIDGGSTDGTVDIIKKYEDKIDYWISEKDSGIYDAMNKGIDIASGNWINFMNAGDTFYDSNVLTHISKSLDNSLSVVSGKVSVFFRNTFIEEYGNSKIIPHQGGFFNTSYMKKLKFNLDYKIYADSELLRRLQNMPTYSSKYIDINIAKFYLGGVGNHPKYFFTRLKEELRIKKIQKQNISLKWLAMQIYNIIGLLFWMIFGEEKYYIIYQKRLLSLMKKLKQGA